MLSAEVIVAIALGLPSLVVAVHALWVAYITFQCSRTKAPERTPS
jgi:hypothetical protein